MGENIAIQGILAKNILGGSLKIIRGSAPLSDLAKISKPIYYDIKKQKGFQREIDQKHAEELKIYFESNTPKFIPEIIIGCRIDSDNKIFSFKGVDSSNRQRGTAKNCRMSFFHRQSHHGSISKNIHT